MRVTAFLGAVLALIFWVFAAIMAELGTENARGRLKADERSRDAYRRRLNEAQHAWNNYTEDEEGRPDRMVFRKILGDFISGGLLFMGAFCLFGLGLCFAIYTLRGKSPVFLIALLSLLLTRWIWQRRAHRRRDLATGQHRREAVLTYVGMVAFPIIGLWLLSTLI
jgi:hypothetical protein